MVSFVGALKAGADGFETDLRLTKDRIIVLCHDDSLDRTTNCTGKISAHTYEEIRACDAGSKFSPKFAGEPVPTFEDAVKFASANNLIVIMDLKEENLAKYFAPILLKYNMQGRAVASCRSDGECTNDVQTYLPNITVHQRLASAPSTWTEAYFTSYVLQNLGGFSLSLDDALTPDFVRAAHRHLMSVFAWTVDTPATWDRCLRDGHDGILTDDPAGAAAYVAAIRAKLFGSLTLEELEKPVLAKDTHRTSPLLIGHRGFPAMFPENTMASFQGAIEAGADGFETDLRLTKDGIIVLSHDPNLDRMTNCTGRIADHTYDEIKWCDAGSKFSPMFAGEHVPTFEQAVQLAVKHGVFIVMDLKEDGLGKQIAQVLKPYNAQSYMIASCRTDAELADVATHLPASIRQRLDEPPAKYDEAFFERYLKLRLHGFSLDYTGAVPLSVGLVKSVHEHLLSIASWTVDQPDLMLKAFRSGHDAILTDNVDQLNQVLTNVRSRVWA